MEESMQKILKSVALVAALAAAPMSTACNSTG
jgi:hypothetical protein